MSLSRRMLILAALAHGCDSPSAAMDAGMDADPPERPMSAFTVTPLKLLGNGRATATLTIRVETGADQPITVSASGAVTIEPQSGVTDGSGTFVTKLTSTQPGAVTLTATSGDLVQTATLTVTPPCPVPLMPGQPGTGLLWPVTGDFNSDGAVDMVGISRSQGGLGFASGNGDGSFQFVEQALMTTDQITSLVAGDFDEDGVLDLAASVNGQQSGLAAFLRGTGTGTFSPSVLYPTNLYPNQIVTGDFDHDAHLDLALMGAADAMPSIGVLFGNGDGTFEQVVIVPTTQEGNNGVVVLATDLNGDGNTDLVSGSYYAPRLTVNLSNGNRTFRAPYDISIALEGTGALAATDLNGDGKTDVLVHGYYPGGFVVLYGDGAGTFPMTRQFANLPMGRSILVGRVDTDSHVDVVLLDGQRMIVHRGDGAGGLTPASEVLTFGGAFFGPGPTPSFALADFDNDGDLDLQHDDDVVLNAAGVLTFELPATEAVESSAAGDFDGDGKLDLATVPLQDFQAATATVAVRRGNGNGTFEAPVTYATGDKPRIVLTGDFNGDTKPDLAVSAERDVTVLLNNGTGQFTASTTLQLPEMMRHWSFVVDDFNGDTKLDLAVSSEPWVAGTASLDVVLGNGDGTFGAVASYPLPPYYIRVITAGALRSSGIVDIVLGPPLTIVPGVGDGTFGAPAAVGGDMGILYNGGIVVADYNGDGMRDVLESSSHLSVRYGNGDGTVGPMVGLAPYPFGNPGLVVDLDGDGALDVIGGDAETNVVLGNGDADRTVGPTLSYPQRSTAAARPPVVGDWNEDGRLDLASTGGLLLQRQCIP